MKKYVFASFVLAFMISISLLAGCGNPTGGGGGGGRGTTPWVYAGNYIDDTIVYLRGSADTVSGSIEVPGYELYHITASPDGKKLYCATGSSEILVVDTSSNEVVDSIFITTEASPTSQSNGMAVSNDGKLLYVILRDDKSLIRVNLETKTCEVIASSFADIPACLLLNADSTVAYVGTSNDSYPCYLYEIPLPGGGTSSMRLAFTNPPGVSRSIQLPNDQARDLAIMDGRIYAPIYGSGNCVIISEEAFQIENMITSDASTSLSIMAVPTKNKLYMSNYVNPGILSIIDASLSIFKSSVITAEAFKCPEYMAISADDKYVYVLNFIPNYGPGSVSGSRLSMVPREDYYVSVVDTATDQIIRTVTIPTGGYLKPVIVYK